MKTGIIGVLTGNALTLRAVGFTPKGLQILAGGWPRSGLPPVGRSQKHNPERVEACRAAACWNPFRVHLGSRRLPGVGGCASNPRLRAVTPSG
jgi:hypothetical protein